MDQNKPNDSGFGNTNSGSIGGGTTGGTGGGYSGGTGGGYGTGSTGSTGSTGGAGGFGTGSPGSGAGGGYGVTSGSDLGAGYGGATGGGTTGGGTGLGGGTGTGSDTGVCAHCGQSLNRGGLEQFLGRLGITEDMVNNLKGQFQNVEIDEYLNTAREYLKNSGGKASSYAKENPGKVAAGVAALALGAGLIYAAVNRGDRDINE